MTRALRWILLAVVLGGAAFLAFFLMQDRPEPPPAQAVAEENGDQLTEEDRQGLNKLIESKVKEKAGDQSP